MLGIPSDAKCGFLTIVHPRFGETFVIMYGPTPGGGLFDRFVLGVLAGTRPAAGNAMTLSKAP